MGCARAESHRLLVEPAFVETEGSPIITTCIAPSAWNCYDRGATRKAALDALEVADLARAIQKPRPPPEKQELAPRVALAEEEEALTALRGYLACHPWDLDLAFELARRNFELNRFADATYLFLRVAENSDDDRAVASFLRALETLNATAVRSTAPECYDEMARRVPTQRARLCAPLLVAKHPGRSEPCTELGKIAYDLERLKAQEASR
jgi:tetratricopeptide (TPR) repeat protein